MRYSTIVYALFLLPVVATNIAVNAFDGVSAEESSEISEQEHVPLEVRWKRSLVLCGVLDSDNMAPTIFLF